LDIREGEGEEEEKYQERRMGNRYPNSKTKCGVPDRNPRSSISKEIDTLSRTPGKEVVLL